MKMSSKIHQNPLKMPSEIWCEKRCRKRSTFYQKWLPKWPPKWPFWTAKVTFGTTSGTMCLQVLFQNSPLLFQNSFLIIFHDFWTLGALFFTISGPCLVWFWDMLFIMFFLVDDICFRIIPSTNAESESKGGGGVSPPGVFDKAPVNGSSNFNSDGVFLPRECWKKLNTYTE